MTKKNVELYLLFEAIAFFPFFPFEDGKDGYIEIGGALWETRFLWMWQGHILVKSEWL